MLMSTDAHLAFIASFVPRISSNEWEPNEAEIINHRTDRARWRHLSYWFRIRDADRVVFEQRHLFERRASPLFAMLMEAVTGLRHVAIMVVARR